MDGLKVNKLKGGYNVNRNYREWLLNYVKQENPAIEKLARYDMVEKFGIKNDTAYREIKKIVEKSEQMQFEIIKDIKMIVYVQ